MGIGSGSLIDALISRTRLYIVAIDRDASKVDSLRRRMTAAGLLRKPGVGLGSRSQHRFRSRPISPICLSAKIPLKTGY